MNSATTYLNRKGKKSMNNQLFRFTLFLLVYLSLPSIAAAQVEISAVPSANNPAVGDTIEISINISSASNVAGYEFKLTFDPTELQFIGIENADYLPTGAFAPEPEVFGGRFSEILCDRCHGNRQT